MPLHELMSTAEIKALFTEEINAAGGTVSDTFDDGVRLFTRSILPQVREVRAADNLQGGVALRATEEDVRVHPYVFRLVCRNGAIIARAIQTRQIEYAEFATSDEVAGALRTAIKECADAEVFAAAAEEIRFASQTEADLALAMLPMLSRMAPEVGSHLMQTIMVRFFNEGDRSRFGLMNAVTSVARDTTDPDLRWRLEELGGSIPASRNPNVQPPEGAARELLMVC